MSSLFLLSLFKATFSCSFAISGINFFISDNKALISIISVILFINFSIKEPASCNGLDLKYNLFKVSTLSKQNFNPF